jgi:hypothetical protein
VLVHFGQQFTSAAFGAQPDFGRVVLGIESQLSLAGIRPRGLSQVDNDLHLVEAASFGEEAAALVLLDDDFTSIVRAVRLGRRIFDNLRKAMSFLLAVQVPIAGLAVLPVLLGWPLILLPVHIVFLELIIDPACSIVFESEPEQRDVMHRPPRRAAEPGLFDTAFTAIDHHPPDARSDELRPLDHIKAALDDLVATGLLDPVRRPNFEYPTWATVHGLAVLFRGPLGSLSDREKTRLQAQTLAFIEASAS